MKFWNIPTVFILLSLLIVFLTRFSFLGHAIYGDGIYYWAYTKSIIIDQNLDLRDESTHSYSPEGNNRPEPKIMPSGRNLAEDKYFPLGASLSWTPGFLLAHFLSRIFGYLPNGYSDIYQISVGILSISFTLFALRLIWQLLQKSYSGFISSLTIVLLLFGTNLFYYSALDTLNTHPFALLLSTIAVFLLFRYKNPSAKQFLYFGITCGLCALTRPQDGLIVILFLPALLQAKKSINFIAFFGGGILGYLPQLVASLLLFRNFLALPYLIGGNGAFNISQPHLLELVFETNRGVLYFAPIYLIAICGLIFYYKMRKPFAGRFLALVIAQIGLISVWSGWAQGESYGMRMLISLIPILAFGLAEIIKYINEYFSKTILIGLAILFITQNLFMILAFHLFLHEPTYINGELSKGGKVKQEIFLRTQDVWQRLN